MADVKTETEDETEELGIYPSLGQELMEGMNQLRIGQDLFDVTVVVGNKPFKAHKAVLASLSGYFQVMFTNPGFIDMNKSEIEIKEDGLSSDSFAHLLDFMYTGKIQMTAISSVLDLLQTAGFLQVKGAIQLCVGYLRNEVLKENISYEMALDLSCTANQLGHPELKNLVDRFVGQNMVKFVKNPDFLEQMTASYLEELLKRKDLNETTSEEELLQVVVEWLQFDWEARQSDTCTVLKNIRFGVIPDHVISDILGTEIETIAKEIINKEDELSSKHRGSITMMMGDVKATFQIVKIDEERQGFRTAIMSEMRIENVKAEVLSDSIIEQDVLYPFSAGQNDVERHYWYDHANEIGISYADDIPDEETLEIDFQHATHKVLTNLPLFQVVQREVVASNGWRLAEYFEVESCLEMVKWHLNRPREWYICTLHGGKVSGCGYHYSLDQGDHPTLGHKLLIRYPQEFSVIPTKVILPQWKLATINEVKRGFSLVKKLLSGKKSGYVCVLQGGSVSGEDSGFQLKESEPNAFILADHQIVVKINKQL